MSHFFFFGFAAEATDELPVRLVRAAMFGVRDGQRHSPMDLAAFRTPHSNRTPREGSADDGDADHDSDAPHAEVAEAETPS